MSHDPYSSYPQLARAGLIQETWRHVQLRALNEVPPLLDLIGLELGLQGFSARDTLGARIGLEEALVNAIKHGNGEDPARCVRIRYQVTDEHLLAEILDEGPGFVPELLPDPFTPENLMRPCGRGVFLMRAYMTWVRFNPVGNGVMLCKRRSAAGASPPAP